MIHHFHDLPERLAATAMGVSTAAAAVSLATSVQVVQIVAGTVAACSGILAGLYYLTKLHEWWKARK